MSDATDILGDMNITDEGEPADTLARLERSGLYTPPATNPAPWPDAPGGRSCTSAEFQALLEEMRGDH